MLLLFLDLQLGRARLLPPQAYLGLLVLEEDPSQVSESKSCFYARTWARNRAS